MIKITKGTRISYEDVANPRRLGTIVDILPENRWGGPQAVVEWEEHDGSTYRDTVNMGTLERLVERNENRPGVAGFRVHLAAVT